MTPQIITGSHIKKYFLKNSGKLLKNPKATPLFFTYTKLKKLFIILILVKGKKWDFINCLLK
jgi:hypothetical protein